MVSACEDSAESYAALLVRLLKERNADMEVDAVGGVPMALAGANLVETREHFSVVGLVEGIGSVPAHLRTLRRLRERFAAGMYDLAVLLDYPGFHLRVAAAASGSDVPVLYYIAPQLWAWGAWRLKVIKKSVQQVAVTLPFEEEYFRQRGVSAEFVGHPLLDQAENPSAEKARSSLGLPEGRRVLGLLPGSRKKEVARLWPCFRDAANLIVESTPSIDVIVAQVQGIEYQGAAESFRFCRDSKIVLAASDAVLCKSGTTTLEAALAGTPMVVAYKMNLLTYGIARCFVRLPYVSLVNLIAEREICPEFLETSATPGALADAVTPLLQVDGESASRQRRGFEELKSRLGGAGATRRVAELVERMVA